MKNLHFHYKVQAQLKQYKISCRMSLQVIGIISNPKNEKFTNIFYITHV